jgi:hypothetical protein
MTSPNMTSLYRAVAIGVLMVAALVASDRVAVVVGDQAPDLERYAAEQLCDYLSKLFGIDTRPETSIPESAGSIFLIGSPRSNQLVRKSRASTRFARLGGQGIVVERTSFGKRPALVVGGPTPQASLWAVYELVERYWGVRYLLHGDILPPPGRFNVPDAHVRMEPLLPVRQWRVVNELACGPASWGLADYRPVLDQLAKMKFNRLLVTLWPHQPFLDYQYAGIRRSSADLFFGYRFPISSEMPGRALFGNAKQFWNPDLPDEGSYEDFTKAGIRHVRGLMAYGRERGMGSVIAVSPLEFPPEFAPALNSSQKIHQLGELSIVPGETTAIDDPKLNGLVTSILQAAVNTYPEAEAIGLGMPEHRQWMKEYQRAWTSFDTRYGVSRDALLDEMIEAAGHRKGFHSAPERAVAEVKGDLVNLFFYDALIRGKKVFESTKRPKIPVIYRNVAEELYPVLGRVLRPGDELLNFVDYTPSRIVRRREALAQVPSKQNPALLIHTLHDDNVGLLPQLATGSFHELTQDLRKHGWSGFSTRYWLIADHDPVIAYLAKASWDEATTPDAVYRDQWNAICGGDCVEPMVEAMRQVEAATLLLEQHGLGFAFPVKGMMMKHWTPKPLAKEMLEVQESYKRALVSAQSARQKAALHRREAVDYWIGRLDYGIRYIEATRLLREAAIAESGGDHEIARRHTEAALDHVVRGIESYARVARDQSDRGAIAMMGELVYRPLKAKADDLRK